MLGLGSDRGGNWGMRGIVWGCGMGLVMLSWLMRMLGVRYRGGIGTGWGGYYCSLKLSVD